MKMTKNGDTLSGSGYNCVSLVYGTDRADVDIKDEKNQGKGCKISI
jgi:hypothetical protein